MHTDAHYVGVCRVWFGWLVNDSLRLCLVAAVKFLEV
jgi:hypothetical protein